MVSDPLTWIILAAQEKAAQERQGRQDDDRNVFFMFVLLRIFLACAAT